MNRIELWCVCVTLFGMATSVGMAQQAGPPNPTGGIGVSLRIAADEPVVPLPPADQPERLLQPANAPVVPPGMTLAELEETAVRCNPTIAQAAQRVEAARGRWVQAGLYPNPTAGYIGAEIGNEGRAGQQGSFVGQEIVTAGKLRLSRDVAQQEIRQA
jgi:outer membrane protein, heavy metal efflux system